MTPIEAQHTALERLHDYIRTAAGRRECKRIRARRCAACGLVPGVVWRRGGLYCLECDAASAPVTLDGETIAAALNPPHGQPVVTARTAIGMLERSAGR